MAKQSNASTNKAGGGGLFALPKALSLPGQDEFTPLLGKPMRVKGTDAVLTLDRVKLYQPGKGLPSGVRERPFTLVFKQQKSLNPLHTGFYNGEFEGGTSVSIHLTALNPDSTGYQEFEAAFS